MKTKSGTIKQVRRRLDENRIAYRVMELTGNHSIVVTEYGGRILGPFRGDELSIMWLNQSFGDKDSFGQMLKGNGPIGGERLWISPEIQFGVTDRKDFWNSLFVPKDVDPGNYRISSESQEINLEQSMELEAYNLASGHKTLNLKRSIKSSRNPLRHLSTYNEMAAKGVFFGYSQTITLEESKNDEIMSEAWTLAQVNPGGIVIVPTISCCETTNYFTAAPDGIINIQDQYLTAGITGTDQYKIGMISTNTIGRVGYISQLAENDYCLLVRCFFSNPTCSYADEAPDKVGRAGHSMHLYNDDGRFGGFGEIETMGQTIGGPGGNSSSTDTSEMWFFRGPLESLKYAGNHLLGSDAVDRAISRL